MVIALLIVFGLSLGSFVNALVWRLHEQAELSRRKKRTKQQAEYLHDLSISRGRSMCPHCHHELAAKDLVPVLSWLSLRGKCRYCQKPISWQYPLVELLMAVIFVFTYLYWPLTLSGQNWVQFAAFLVLLVGFMALSVYDILWFLLPDRLIAPLTFIAVVTVLFVSFTSHDGLATFANAAGGATVIAILFYALFWFSKGQWIGGGDVKLAPMLGLLAGNPIKALLVVFFASLIGLLVAVPLMIRGKANRSSHIPFGPCLMAATLLVVLFGGDIVHAYEAVFTLN